MTTDKPCRCGPMAARIPSAPAERDRLAAEVERLRSESVASFARAREWAERCGAAQEEVSRLRADGERTIRELEAHRLYARALCKAVDAATDFAGTVAGGAAWWDDVWADHAAALDRARDRITDAAIDAAMTGERGA